MKYSAEKFLATCGCRSAGECGHNSFAERKALSALIDDFSAAMKMVLLGKLYKKSGWDDPAWTIDELEHQLLDHAVKAMERRRTGTTRMNDAIDIANFAAFLWNKTTDGYVNAESEPIAAVQPEDPLTEIYRIATRALAEPGDHSGKLVSICTLIEDGFAPAVEGPKDRCGLCGGNGICPCVSRDKTLRHVCGRCNGTGVECADVQASEEPHFIVNESGRVEADTSILVYSDEAQRAMRKAEAVAPDLAKNIQRY